MSTGFDFQQCQIDPTIRQGGATKTTGLLKMRCALWDIPERPKWYKRNLAPVFSHLHLPKPRYHIIPPRFRSSRTARRTKKNKQFTNLAHQTLFGWLNSHYHSLYYPSFPELDKNVVIKIAVWTEVFFLDQGICWTSGKDFKSLEHGTSSTFVPGSGRSNSKKRSNKKISEWGGKNKTTILELQFDCCAFYFWVPY